MNNADTFQANAYVKTKIKVLSKVKNLKKNDLFKKSVTNLFIQVASLALSYLVVFSISKYFNAATLGYYTLANVMLMLASMFVLMGTNAATIIMVPGYKVKNDYAAVSTIFMKGTLHIVIVGTVVTVLLFFGAPFIATNIMHKPGLILPYKINALAIVPAALLSFFAEFLRGYGKTLLWALISKIFVFLIFIILFMALAIFYTVPEPNVIYCIANFISFCIVCFIMFYFLPKAKITFSLENLRAAPSYKQIRKGSFPMFLFNATLLLRNWVSVLMLGSLGTAEQTGIFRVLDRVSSLNVLVLTSVNAVLAPKVSAAFAQKKIGLIRHDVDNSNKLIFWGSLPFQIILLLFPAFVLGLFGKEFSVGKYGLIILCLGTLINSLTGPVSLVLTMTKHQIFIRNTSVFSFVISIILNYLLIPRWGIEGAAIAIVCSSTFLNVVGVIKIKKEFDFLIVYNPFSLKLFGGNKNR